MKDLLVYVADADVMAFLRSILNKHEALGTRSFSFDIERHPQRDAGMVQSGAELARMKKGLYSRALLMWDHHGSGRDHRQSPQDVSKEIQRKLDVFTWEGISAAIVLVPEFEQWVWYCEAAIAAHFKVAAEQLQRWVDERAQSVGKSPQYLKTAAPKELFEHLIRERLRKTISPRDFEGIGRGAGVNKLKECDSFKLMSAALQLWFPRVES